MATPKQIPDVILHLANKLPEYLTRQNMVVIAVVVGLVMVMIDNWLLTPSQPRSLYQGDGDEDDGGGCGGGGGGGGGSGGGGLEVEP